MSVNYKNIKLKETGDGSHTLYVPALNEHFHSLHGAIQESEHVFLKMGFKAIADKDPVRILEVGMGTGLNVLLTFISNTVLKREVHYTAIEKFPLSLGTVQKLNYDQYFEPVYADVFQKIHESPMNETCQLSAQFLLNKLEIDWLGFQSEKMFDLVYFDAFGPDKQPEMWSQEVFQRLYDQMEEEGVLVTYSAKGLIKRRLKQVGFQVESLEGPPGKREMIRAVRRDE